MRLANYEFAEVVDKKEWINSMSMSVGLSYFGGKSVIGKYIFNNIFNLSVEMKEKGRKPDIFIDAFTGGGKMGLSVPYGWYDTIVMNDLNYGVYSYYKCCQENHIALIYMIEKIGEIMCEDLFCIAAYLRSFGINVDKWQDGTDFVSENEVVDPLVAGALTYWVTAGAFNGQTAPDSIAYTLIRKDKSNKENKDNKEQEYTAEERRKEQENIQKIIKRAYKNIPKIHERLNKQHYIIENLDYRELIKKYNGKEWHDINWKSKEDYKKILMQRDEYDEDTFEAAYKTFTSEHTHVNEEYAKKNKLWYFDPPYHPWCLHAGENAPYADTFSVELANEMVNILCGDRKDEFGEIEFFIKSDYDPKEALERAKRAKESESQYKWYQQLKAMEAGRDDIKKEFDISEYEESIKWKEGMISTLFEKLEIYPFCKVCVGGFDKGAINKEHKKNIGQEFIWCRGFSEGYEFIEGESAK